MSDSHVRSNRQRIDAIADQANTEQIAASTKTEVAKIIGVHAFGGLRVLADNLDVLTARLNEIEVRATPEMSEVVAGVAELQRNIADLRRDVKKVAKALGKASK